jgi:SET domain-containing protein
MPVISPKKPYRVGRSRTGLGLFATQRIKKGTKIIRYFGPLLDSKKKKDDAIENKYLFELNNRWTIDGSVRKNVARYINHACKPNAESDVRPRKRKVFIRAIKNIEPGDEINYDYGTDYFKAYLKPIGCKCAACEKKRKKKRAEARAERLRLKAKAERKAKKEAEKEAAKRAKAKSRAKAKKAKEKAKVELKPERKRKVVSKRRVANGLQLNGSTPSRRSRPKTAATLAVVEQPIAATGEASAILQASNLTMSAATGTETQQASA